MKKKKGQKVFVLDTSVLINDPEVINRLGDNVVVVPIWVVEEMDNLKRSSNQSVAAAAREASKIISNYIERGLKEGHNGFPNSFRTDAGGTLFFETNGKDFSALPEGLAITNDNRVIAVAKSWQVKNEYGEVILLSSDTNMRIKATACKIVSEPYLFDRKIARIEDMYTGLTTLQIGPTNNYLLGQLAQQHFLSAEVIVCDTSALLYNQCCILAAGDKTQLGLWKGDRLVHVPKWQERGPRNREISPCNLYQSFALALALDPEVRLVSLLGPAGSGKTLMALLAAQKLVLEQERHSTIQVYRPNWELGKEIGFLKGSEGEKFAPWKQPIYDIFKVLIRNAQESKSGKPGDKKTPPGIELEQQEILEISPINFLLGRTLEDMFVVVDEAQNFTRREMEAILTRLAYGSKMILTGSLRQITNPYVDELSNGMSCAIELYRQALAGGMPIKYFGHITMLTVERDEIAADVEKIFNSSAPPK